MVEAEGIKFAGVTSKAEAPYVKGKLGSRHHPQIAHFEFLKANTKRTAKMTIPSPSMLHYRGGRQHDRSRRLSEHGGVLSRSRSSL